MDPIRLRPWRTRRVRHDHSSVTDLTTAKAKASRQPPVRVRLRRLNASLAKAYPPDGLQKGWWERLKKALGTTSGAFVDASLCQLEAAADSAQGRDFGGARYPDGVLPYGRDGSSRPARRRSRDGTARQWEMATAAARLLRAYAVQVDSLRRLQRGPDQVIRIERVDIHEGAQAIVGVVTTSNEKS